MLFSWLLTQHYPLVVTQVTAHRLTVDQGWVSIIGLDALDYWRREATRITHAESEHISPRYPPSRRDPELELFLPEWPEPQRSSHQSGCQVRHAETLDSSGPDTQKHQQRKKLNDDSLAQICGSWNQETSCMRIRGRPIYRLGWYQSVVR